MRRLPPHRRVERLGGEPSERRRRPRSVASRGRRRSAGGRPGAPGGGLPTGGGAALPSPPAAAPGPAPWGWPLRARSAATSSSWRWSSSQAGDSRPRVARASTCMTCPTRPPMQYSRNRTHERVCVWVAAQYSPYASRNPAQTASGVASESTSGRPAMLRWARGGPPLLTCAGSSYQPQVDRCPCVPVADSSGGSADLWQASDPACQWPAGEGALAAPAASVCSASGRTGTPLECQ